MFKILLVLLLLLVTMLGLKYKFTDNKPTSLMLVNKSANTNIKPTNANIKPTNTNKPASAPVQSSTKPPVEPLINAKKSERKVTFAKKSLRRDITPEGKFIEYKLDVKK